MFGVTVLFFSSAGGGGRGGGGAAAAAGTKVDVESSCTPSHTDEIHQKDAGDLQAEAEEKKALVASIRIADSGNVASSYGMATQGSYEA